MKTYHAIVISAVAALCGANAWAQTNRISTVSIGTAITGGGTANGVATVTERIGTVANQQGSVGNNLAGIAYVAGGIPGASDTSISLFTLTGVAIPGGAGNPANSFTSYGTLIAPTVVGSYADVAPLLTASSYSGLTFSIADLGFGANDFYMIHHKPGTDYFAEIVPATGGGSAVFDLKPMSWQAPAGAPGGPASSGTTGYFGIAWATGIGAAGAPYADQSIYYLRTDTSSHTQFGVMIPALTSASQDTLDLTNAVGSFGVGGYTTLAFSPTDVGFGTNQFYYLRQDNGPGGTGNTILGRLNPSLAAGTRTISDIANLGGVFNALTYAADATGPSSAWGGTQFFVSGALVAASQSVSFEAVPNHHVNDVFVVTPTASSGLDMDVTVVSGRANVQTTGVSGANPSLRVFTITVTGAGTVTLQARQAGQANGPAYAANFLRQSFTVIPNSVASDFDADVQSDIVWSNMSTGVRYLWLMNGTSFSSNAYLATISTQWTVTTGDFNGDGKADLLWSNSVNGDRYIWLMNGATFGSSTFIGNVPTQWTVATGDFNGDGKSDLLWTNTANGDRYVWFMNGTTFVSSQFLATVPPQWTVTTGDFNSDGKADLVWSDTVSGDRYIWLMNGTHFGSGVFIGNIGTQWTVSTGDFNMDGQTDLLWSNTVNGDHYIWLMNGTNLGVTKFIGNVATQWQVGN